MTPPGTLETLGGSGLEALARGVLVLLVLSLAGERLAAVFKRRDWQPLRPRLALDARRKRSGLLQVDLRTGEVSVEARPAASGGGVGSNEVDRLMRAAHAENTLFIGVLIALLTGANAFLGSCGWPDLAELRFAFVAQVLLTGAASAVGASFWYELLNLLTEARRSRSSGQGWAPGELSPPLPAQPFAPPTDPSSAFLSAPAPPVSLEALRAAALRRLPELRTLPGVKAIRLVDAPRRGPTHPCLEFQVEQEPGAAPLPEEIPVHVEGVEHFIPVRT